MLEKEKSWNKRKGEHLIQFQVFFSLFTGFPPQSSCSYPSMFLTTKGVPQGTMLAPLVLLWGRHVQGDVPCTFFIYTACGKLIK